MKRIAKLIYFFISIIVLILVYFLIKNNLDVIKESLFNLSFLDFLIIIILTLITILLNGNKIEILTRHYGLKLKFKEWFGLSSITTMGNYLAPLGLGMSLRGAYLKKKYKFPYKLFLTTLGTSYITSFLLYGLIGIILLTFLYINNKFFNSIIFFIFLIMFLASFSIILISPNIKNTKSKFLNQFIETINNWNKMKRNRRLLLKLSINDVFSLLIYSFRIYFIFYILNNQISFMSSILVSLVTVSSLIIGLTPASLGIKEALIIFSTKIIGKSLSLGVIVAAIDRGVAILCVFILGGIFSYFLLKDLRKSNIL